MRRRPTVEEGETLTVRGERFTVVEVSGDPAEEWPGEVEGEGERARVETGGCKFRVPLCLLIEIKKRRATLRRMRGRLALARGDL